MTVIGLIHSTRRAIEPVHEDLAAACPDAELIHLLDEGVLRCLSPDGQIPESVVLRLKEMVTAAEAGGADMAVVTCSSLSRAVSALKADTAIALIRIDAPMMAWAVSNARRIGLVMTNPSTVQPSTALIREMAARRKDHEIQVVSQMCPAAFQQLNRGDAAGHDRAVVRAVTRLAPEVDVVLLAQVSMARVKRRLPKALAGKVFTSLDFIADRIKDLTEKPMS